MLKNNFKIALRNLTRNGVSAFINVGGLAVGMAVALLIGLWIYDEFSFNKYFGNYDRIGMIMTKWELSNGARSSEPMPLGTTLGSSFGQDFKSVVLSTQTEYHVVAAGDKKFAEQGKFMQAGAPKMFSFHMLQGDRSGLKDINSIMISSSLAQKLFAGADPMGRLLKMDNQQAVKVTGVFEDFPKNTDFDGLTFFSPLDLYVSLNPYLMPLQHNWNNNWINIYVQLAPDADFQAINTKIAGLKRGHVSQEEAAAKPTVFLHPMAKWHLHSAFGQGGMEKESGELQTVWFYGIIGVFVLFLACINFMNLSTARSEKRAREVGIRKVIGSMRMQLIGQFFSESILITAFAFCAAILLALLVLPWFNDMSGKHLHILWENPFFWLSGIAFIIFTGAVAGSYPALYLSSFKPVSVLKGSFRTGRLAALPRKVLVVVQFTVSIALIIGTVVVYRQIDFAKDRPVGYTRESLLTVPIADPNFKNFELLENELKNTGAVTQVAESASPLTNIASGNSGLQWIGKDPSFKDQFGTIGITPGYGKAIGWTLISGRDFSRDLSDSAGFVVNEAAVKYMGLSNPIGQSIQWPRYKGKNFRILGVVKDMVMNSPFEPAVPTIFFLPPDDPKNFIFIKLNPNSSASNALSKIVGIFNNLMPAAPFAYQFADDDFAAKFAAEERIGKFAGFFGTLAILISCLGLFGLVSYVAEQRKKELGVRKILGASVLNLWGMLSKDFLILVLISFFIACPLAFYIMYTWLQKYAYHTPLSWWIFAAAGVCAMMITLLTISFQSLKAAVTNPVKSLRSE